MKLKPKSISAEYINDDEDYTVMNMMGSVTLVYGSKRKKNCKAIAFKNEKMLGEVIGNLSAAYVVMKRIRQEKEKENG